MDRIRATLKDGQSGSADELVQTLKDVCTAVHGEDLERCRTMGRLGAEWLWKKRGQGKKDGLKLVTVCNTGSLATSVRRCCAFLDRLTYRATELLSESSPPHSKLINLTGLTTPRLPRTTKVRASGVAVADVRVSSDFARADNVANPINYDL